MAAGDAAGRCRFFGGRRSLIHGIFPPQAYKFSRISAFSRNQGPIFFDDSSKISG